MAVQQCRVSRQRVRQRQAANRYRGIKPGACATCGEPVMPHRVCGKCGHYKGRQVLSVTSE